MATKFIESGGDATQGLESYNSITGSNVSINTSVSHTGPASLKMNAGSPAATQIASQSGILADTGRRGSFWFRFEALPSGGVNLVRFQTAAATNVAFIVVDASGHVGASSGTGFFGTTVMSTNTWYRISWAYVITATNNFTIKVWLNGTLEKTITQADATLARTGTDKFDFQENTAWGANISLWFDDIYIDDSSALTDVGDIRVTAKLPFANGTTNGFTGTGTPSGYGTGNARYVNERPLSKTNYVSVIAAGVTTEEYNIEKPNVTDVNINGQEIVDFAGWLYATAALSETASMMLDSSTANSVALTSTDTLFTAFAGKKTYPAGTGTDIGLVTTGLATTVTLYECGILIAYKYPGYFFGG